MKKYTQDDWDAFNAEYDKCLRNLEALNLIRKEQFKLLLPLKCEECGTEILNRFCSGICEALWEDQNGGVKA